MSQTAPSPLYDLTAFQRDLLASIAGLEDEQPCGLDIKTDLEAAYETELNHGHMYPNLDTLVEKGLVTKGAANQRTNEYELTERGRRELRAQTKWTASKVRGDA